MRSNLTAIAAACSETQVAWLDVQGERTAITLTENATPIKLGPDEDPPITLTWSPNGRTLAIARGDGVRLWSVDNQRSPAAVHASSRLLHADGGRPIGVVFHPKGDLVALFTRTTTNDMIDHTASKAGIHIHRLDGTMVAHFADTRPIRSVAWHPSRNLLFVGGGTRSSGNLWSWNGKKIRVWSVLEKRKLVERAGHSATFSGDGRRVAVDLGHRRTGGQNSRGEMTGATTEVRDTRTWRLLARTRGELAGISEDGRRLLIDDAVRGWNYVTWRVGSRPKPFGSFNHQHVVYNTHDHVVTDDFVHHPGGKNALPEGFWWARKLREGILLGGEPHFSRVKRQLFHMNSSRVVGIHSVDDPSTCRLAFIEEAAPAYLGDPEVAHTCGPENAIASPALLSSFLAGSSSSQPRRRREASP